MIRDHDQIVIEEFNGLWHRGDADSCPADHFPNCNNIQFIESGFKWRDGVDTFLAYFDVLRIYTYIQPDQQSVLVLDSVGNIYHSESPTPNTPILTVVGMIDFAFVNIAGRAYLSPHNGVTGLQNENIYVYLGDGTPARPIGATAPAPVGTFTAANSGNAGHVEAGYHIFGVVFETDTGFLSRIGPIPLTSNAASVNAPGTETVDLTNIPVSGDSFVTKRHIVVTKAIDPATYTGNLAGYEFFFLPSAVISDNTTTSLEVDFFDSELLISAEYLIDINNDMDAVVGLNTYHGRMLAWTSFDNPNIVYVSFPGEPEAFDPVTGLIVTNRDGLPVTNCQEFRDVLYVFKQTKTTGYSDNADVPTSWAPNIIDEGIGASVHGICTVLDSGGINVDYIITIDYSGVMIFNGFYSRPDGELSWKIRDLWSQLDRTDFKNIQILNDTINQVIYITLPDRFMFIADYKNGLNPKAIRWAPWSFVFETSTITLFDFSTLVIGARRKAEDVIEPQIVINEPDNGDAVVGTVTIEAGVISPVGVASVQFFIDGVALTPTVIIPPFEIDWDTTGYSNGAHIITAIVTDNNGLTATSLPISVNAKNAITNLAQADHFMYLSYYLDWSFYGNYRNEVIGTTNLMLIWDYYMGGNLVDLNSSFVDAVSINIASGGAKDIMFGPNTNPSDTTITAAALAGLDVAKNYWDNVNLVYFDELGMNQSDMETFINDWNTELTSRGLSIKPIMINFTETQINSGTGWLANNLDYVGVEAYLNSSDQNNNVDTILTAKLAALKATINGGGKNMSFIVLQGYKGPACDWTNLTSLRQMQITAYNSVYNDPDVLAMLIFSYARPCGTRELNGEIRNAHIAIWNALIP